MDVADSQFMRALLTRIDVMIDEKTDQIVNRTAKSYDEYLAMCMSVVTLREIAQTCVDLGKALGHEAQLQRDNPIINRDPDEGRSRKQRPTYRA